MYFYESGVVEQQPVKTENIKDHKIHKEFVEVNDY